MRMFQTLPRRTVTNRYASREMARDGSPLAWALQIQRRGPYGPVGGPRMRKSKNAVRTRLVRAGLTTGAVGAALLVAPSAALAAITVPTNVVAPGTTGIVFKDDVTSSGT